MSLSSTASTGGVEVKVMRPNLTVISKPGYWPTAQDSAPPSVTPAAPK